MEGQVPAMFPWPFRPIRGGADDGGDNPDGQKPTGGDTPDKEGSKPTGGDTPTPAPTTDKGGDADKDTPDTFSREYVESLRAEAAKNRKEAQEARTKAQEYEDRDKSEAQKAADKAAREAKRADSAEAKLLRFEVASAKKVPSEAMDLLTATTREDLEAQADTVLKIAAAKRTADFDGGPRQTPDKELTPEQEHAHDLLKIFGREPGEPTAEPTAPE